MMPEMETFQYEIGLQLFSIFLHRFHPLHAVDGQLAMAFQKALMIKPKAQAQLQAYIE